MIQIDKLKVRYKDVLALDIDEAFTIKTNEKLGIVGSNGAGKTTFVKALLGLIPYEGRIKMDISLNDIGVHMQTNHYAELSCKVIMEMLLGCPISKHPLAGELVDFFEFRPLLKRRFNKLSGGEQQKFTMILVLSQQKPVTIIDEVTSGLDFENRQLMIDKIKERYKDFQGNLIIVSHYYDELEQLVDKLLILDKGKVVDYGYADELFKKYCGEMVISMEYSEKYLELFKDFKRISSKNGMLAYGFSDKYEIKRMNEILLDNDISYKQTNKDFELIIINAKERCNHA